MGEASERAIRGNSPPEEGASATDGRRPFDSLRSLRPFDVSLEAMSEAAKRTSRMVQVPHRPPRNPASIKAFHALSTQGNTTRRREYSQSTANRGGLRCRESLTLLRHERGIAFWLQGVPHSRGSGSSPD